MERKKLFRILRRVLLILGALVVSLVVARYRGFAMEQPFKLNARYLSDGFFVVGFMLTGMGALIWISTTGFFDIMGYGVRSLIVLFSSLKRIHEHPTYYDYKMEREARRGKPNFVMLFTGIGYLALSAIFLALYYA